MGKCQHCVEVEEHLIDAIQSSPYGKLIQKCSVCGKMWGIDKATRLPVEVDDDGDRVKKPGKQWLAFRNDPRRGGPR